MKVKDEFLFLLTGFGPFPGIINNRTARIVADFSKRFQEIAKRFINTTIKFEIRREILPSSYMEAGERIIELFSMLEPDLWIGTGVIRTGNIIRLERFAMNLDDSETEDFSGDFRSNVTIRNHAPDLYKTNLNLEVIIRQLKDKNIPAIISNHAGTYVCNHVYYSALYFNQFELEGKVKAGFVHIPQDSDVMRDNTIMDALEIIFLEEYNQIIELIDN